MAIPDRLLFLWTGRHFPYYARLAIESALYAEPDAAMELALFGERPGGRHLEAVAGYRRVKLVDIDPTRLFRGLAAPPERYLELYGAIPASAASARANLLRLALLHEHGGVYLDLDVLLVSGLEELRRGRDFVGAERVWRHDEARVRGALRVSDALGVAAFGAMWAAHQLRAGWLAPAIPATWIDRLDPLWSALAVNNAVLGAEPGGELTRRALALALDCDPTIRFALGPTLLTRMVREAGDAIAVLPPEVFFAVPPSQSFRLFRDRTLRLPSEARLVHWVASNHRGLERLEGPALTDGPGVFHRLARAAAQHADSLPRARS